MPDSSQRSEDSGQATSPVLFGLGLFLIGIAMSAFASIQVDSLSLRKDRLNPIHYKARIGNLNFLRGFGRFVVTPAGVIVAAVGLTLRRQRKVEERPPGE